MMKILRSSILWASDASFLNDAKELVLNTEVTSAALRQLQAEAEARPGYKFLSGPDATQARVAGQLADFIEASGRHRRHGPHMYVTCFCAGGDVLSQWRAYGKGGYSIGFDPEALKVCELVGFIPRESVRSFYEGARPSLELIEVNYVDDNLTELDEDLLRQLRDVLITTGDRGVPFLRGQWNALLFQAGLKHVGFGEEREWRLAYPLRSDRGYEVPGSEFITKLEDTEAFGPTLQFREAPLAIVPYIELRYPAGAVKHIVVGPGGNQDLRVVAVERYLDEIGVDAEVRASRIPYRPN